MTKAALEQELVQLRTDYAREDARGIPMSVRERYEKRLTELRRELREEGNVPTVQEPSLPA